MPRVVRLLVLAITATCLCAGDDAGSVVVGRYYRIRSERLGEERTIIVRLPDDYGTSQKQYPVIFKLDGEDDGFSLAMASIDYLSGIADAAPRSILVGIQNKDRNRDMFPERGADRFSEFITTELVPYVTGHFRTSPVRILCGQSLSSVFAMHLFLKSPETFDGYVLSSFGLSPEWHQRFLEKLPAIRDSGKARVFFYVSNGSLDPYDPDGARGKRGLRFIDSLRSVGKPRLEIRYRLYAEEGHVPFPSLCDGIRWIYSSRNLGDDH